LLRQAAGNASLLRFKNFDILSKLAVGTDQVQAENEDESVQFSEIIAIVSVGGLEIKFLRVRRF
jgi:hypothetical protein